MPRDIEDFELSDDARRLYDWMIAAFTMDINAAMADAERYGAWPTRWPRDRVQKAHVELKTAGVLSADAPDLKPAHAHATRKKKSPAQLDAEIAEVLASKPTRFGQRERSDLRTKASSITDDQLRELRAWAEGISKQTGGYAKGRNILHEVAVALGEERAPSGSSRALMRARSADRFQREIAQSFKPYDISATTATGTADRMLVWASSRDEAIAKFKRDSPRWKIVGVREASEIDPSARVP